MPSSEAELLVAGEFLDDVAVAGERQLVARQPLGGIGFLESGFLFLAGLAPNLDVQGGGNLVVDLNHVGDAHFIRARAALQHDLLRRLVLDAPRQHVLFFLGAIVVGDAIGSLGTKGSGNEKQQKKATREGHALHRGSTSGHDFQSARSASAGHSTRSRKLDLPYGIRPSVHLPPFCRSYSSFSSFSWESSSWKRAWDASPPKSGQAFSSFTV